MSTSTPSRRMRRQVVPVVALAAVGAVGGVAVLSGCGSSASAGSAPASIAGYIPASSPLYVQVSTDTDGKQWTSLKRLGALFPGFGDMRADVDKALAREGVNWEKDLKPLLGDTAAVAAVQVPDVASAAQGALTDPAAAAGRAAAKAADEPMLAVLQIAEGKSDALKALIAKNPSGLKETGTQDGATLYADATAGVYGAVTGESLILGSTQAVVKQALEVKAEGGEAALSGIFRFNDALALLPDDVFAMAYMNLDEVGKSAGALVPQVGTLAGGQVKGAAAMSVTAAEDGLRMKAVLVDAPPMAKQQAFTPALTAQAPAGTVAYLGFNRLADTVQTALDAAGEAASEDTRKQLDALTGQLPLLLGVNANDLRNLTGGEHAVVVTGQGEMPDVALALDVANGAQAAKSLTALSKSIPVVVKQFGSDSVKVGTATAFANGAVKGQALAVQGKGSIAWGVRGDTAAIGNGVRAVGSVLVDRPQGESLAASAAFKAATAGMPDQVTGLAYVNMDRVVPILAANGGFDGKDGQRRRADLEPVKQIAAWSTGGDTPTVEVFVGLGK